MGRLAKPDKPRPKTVSLLLTELSEGHTKSSNNVPLLISRLISNSEQAEDITDGLQAYFLARLEDGVLVLGTAGSSDQAAASSSNARSSYAAWLQRQYSAYKAALLGTLSGVHPDAIQLAAVHAWMDLVGAARATDIDHEMYAELLEAVLSREAVASAVLQLLLTSFLGYADVRYYTLRTVSKLCSAQEKAASPAPADFAASVLDVLLHTPGAFDLDAGSWCGAAEAGGVAGAEAGEGVRARRKRQRLEQEAGLKAERRVRWASPKLQQKAYSEAWLAFLRLPLPRPLLHRVLEAMPDIVIPALPNPLLLCDFFTRALDAGGFTGVLALQSIFILVTRHGLEYPRFFERLYGLLTLDTLQSRHRARFFALADAFLASALVPAYTIAAFCKRFARLALRAGPPGALICVAFIHNMLRRHPACTQLVHRLPVAASAAERTPEEQQGGDDPYDPTCADPACSRALESSLWEITVLKRHANPQVATYAGVLDKDLSQRAKSTEEDFTDATQASYTSLFDAELKRRLKAVPTAFYRENPTSVLSPALLQDFPGWSA